MTAPPKRLPWWRYIGPWELRPGAIGLLYFIFAGFAAVIAGSVAKGDLAAAFLAAIPGTFVGTGVVVAALALLHRLHADRTLVAYLAGTFLTGLLGILSRVVLGGPTVPVLLGTTGSVVSYVVRSWVFLLVVGAVLGVSTRRLQLQVDATQAALAQTREQQEWMLAADERVRRQVADALHDRVQAGLIAACLQLQALPTTDAEGLERVIGRLEDLRRLDVRGLARALSPALAEVGLASALEDLAAQYEPGLVATVTVDESVEQVAGDPGLQVRLGCYRIAEQALLNAAVHGRARACTISVLSQGEGVELRVSDDGAGLGGVPTSSGLGSALMTTWARALEGEWSMAPSASGGVEVVARLRPPVSHM